MQYSRDLSSYKVSINCYWHNLQPNDVQPCKLWTYVNVNKPLFVTRITLLCLDKQLHNRLTSNHSFGVGLQNVVIEHRIAECCTNPVDWIVTPEEWVFVESAFSMQFYIVESTLLHNAFFFCKFAGWEVWCTAVIKQIKATIQTQTFVNLVWNQWINKLNQFIMKTAIYTEYKSGIPSREELRANLFDSHV